MAIKDGHSARRSDCGGSRHCHHHRSPPPPPPPTPTVATVAATIRGGGFGEVGGVLAQLELLGPGDPLVQLLRVVSCPKMRSSLAAISAGSGTPDMVVDAL